jgi:hypothetical protein
LPAGNGPGPTSVTEIEKTTSTTENPEPQLQYSETQYSQSSDDVDPGGVLPEGVSLSKDGTSATQTVTDVKSWDPEKNDFVEASSLATEVKVVGTRDNGEEVSISRIDTSNSAGETTTTHDVNGLTRDELRRNLTGPYGTGGVAPEKVGESSVDLLPETVDGKHPDEHLRDKGDTPNADGGDAIGFLGVEGDRDEPIDLEVTVVKDANGQPTESVTWENTADNGDGPKVTRLSSGDDVQWTYQKTLNGGDDIHTQIVYEGSNVSTYSHRHNTGDGTFKLTTETRVGDQVSSTQTAERAQVTEKQLREHLDSGDLSKAEFDRMLQAGGPYYLESNEARMNAYTDGDDKLVRDQDGNPVQGGYYSSTNTFSGSDGYAVTNALSVDHAELTEQEIHSVSDPFGNPPVTADFTKRTYQRDPLDAVGRALLDQPGEGLAELKKTETERLEITSDGRYLLSDGENGEKTEVAQLNLDGVSLHDFLKERPGMAGIELGLGAIASAKDITTGSLGLLRDQTSTTATWMNDKLDVLEKFTGVATAAWGASEMIHGVLEADAYKVVGGVSAAAAGTLPTVSAIQALGSRYHQGWAGSLDSVTQGTRLAKGLGALGAGASIAIGITDLMKADNGYDQTAAGMTVASGVLAALSIGCPPLLIGAAALTITSYFVGMGDANNTAGIDPRMGES